MESQFKYWEIENYERISAYDGREDDLSDIIKGKYPDMMTSGEIGCSAERFCPAWSCHAPPYRLLNLILFFRANSDLRGTNSMMSIPGTCLAIIEQLI